jgi:hypothetical protein
MGLEELGFTDASKETKRRAIQLIVAGVLLITLLLGVTSYNAYLTTSEQTGTADAVKNWLGDTSFQIVGIKVRPTEVDITIRGDSQVPPLENLYSRLSSLYGHPAKINLHVTPYQSQSFP